MEKFLSGFCYIWFLKFYKVHKFFSRKNIIVIIFISLLLLCVLILVKYIFGSRENFTNGKAEFYKLECNECDSIVRSLKIKSKVEALLIREDSLPIGYSAKLYGFQFELDGKYLFNAVYSNSLSVLDSKNFTAYPQYIISSVRDSLFLQYYFSLQTELISKNNKNGLILEIPQELYSCDTTYYKVFLENLKLRITYLHKAKILSFIDFSGIDSNISHKIFDDISSIGLCGVVSNNLDFINYLNSKKFDGIIVYKTNEILSSDKIIESKIPDIFIYTGNTKYDKENFVRTFKKNYKKFEVDLKIYKILRAVNWIKSAGEYNSDFDADSIKVKILKSRLIQSSFVLIRNEKELIPLKEINLGIRIFAYHKDRCSDFINALSEYSNNFNVTYYNLNSKLSCPEKRSLMIFLYENLSGQIDENILNFVNKCECKKLFINIGVLNESLLNTNADVIINSYFDSSEALSLLAQSVFGGIGINGILPISLNDSIKAGYGLRTESSRIRYTLPEEVGINSQVLLRIDSLVQNAMNKGAFPGCQVFAIKDGVVIYDKSFGYKDYSKSSPVTKFTMYDVASLTKIFSTTLAMMKMVETGKIKLNDKFGDYFKNKKINYFKIKPDTVVFIDTVSILNKTKKEIEKIVQNKDSIHINDTLIVIYDTIITRPTPSSNIFTVPIRSLLVHQSGVAPSLPILDYLFYVDSYKKQFKDSLEKWEKEGKKIDIRKNAFDYYFSETYNKDSARRKIAEGMYLRKNWEDSIYEDIKRLGTFNREKYQYTDMNMILVQMIIDTVNKKPIDKFLSEEFYKPLGLFYTCFNPLDNNYKKENIAPTEKDLHWRRQLIHGTVHDPSAAMLGGISGNAGLFSCARDLAILGQMLLNNGYYGGLRFLSPQTVKLFTSKQPENHRGLGFDKASEKNLNALSASTSTYGHTGFTGCVMWVDPEYKLVYVFLSNRIHPDSKNQKHLSLKIYRNIHQVFYDAMISGTNN